MTGIVFLDRDGTINDLIYDPELKFKRGPRTLDELVIKKDAPEAIKNLSRKFVVAIVTNQPDLSRGKMSKVDLCMVNGKITRTVVEIGGKIDYFLHCPHTADYDCDCRKPKTGMFTHVLAIEGSKFPLWTVGDEVCDVEAGKSIGARTVQIGNIDGNPDFVVSNLLEASKLILEQ